MRKSVLWVASLSSVALLTTGCQSSLTGDTYSRDEARTVQTVRLGTIESLRPVKIEGTKTPIGAGAGAVIGGVGGSSVGGGKGELTGSSQLDRAVFLIGTRQATQRQLAAFFDVVADSRITGRD